MKLQNIRTFFLLIPALSIVPSTASADIVKVKFEGVVTNVDQRIRRDNESEQSYADRDSNAFSPGDKFSGVYTFDTNTPSVIAGQFDQIDSFPNTIKSMSFNSNNKKMITKSSGGDILITDSGGANGYLRYKYNYGVNFSGMTGKQLIYRYDDGLSGFSGLMQAKNYFKPVKLELLWGLTADYANGDLPSIIQGGLLSANPHFDSNKAWQDSYDWAIPAPNYGHIKLTYSHVGGTGGEPEMTGRIYSVKKVLSFSTPIRIDDLDRTFDIPVSNPDLGGRMLWITD